MFCWICWWHGLTLGSAKTSDMALGSWLLALGSWPEPGLQATRPEPELQATDCRPTGYRLPEQATDTGWVQVQAPRTARLRTTRPGLQATEHRLQATGLGYRLQATLGYRHNLQAWATGHKATNYKPPGTNGDIHGTPRHARMDRTD
jgi:hypothetical protein